MAEARRVASTSCRKHKNQSKDRDQNHADDKSGDFPPPPPTSFLEEDLNAIVR